MAALQLGAEAPALLLLPRLEDAAVAAQEPCTAVAALVQHLQALPPPLDQALVLYDVESTLEGSELPAAAAARAPAGPHSSLYSSSSTRRIISIKVCARRGGARAAGWGGRCMHACMGLCMHTVATSS